MTEMSALLGCDTVQFGTQTLPSSSGPAPSLVPLPLTEFPLHLVDLPFTLAVQNSVLGQAPRRQPQYFTEFLIKLP